MTTFRAATSSPAGSLPLAAQPGEHHDLSLAGAAAGRATTVAAPNAGTTLRAAPNPCFQGTTDPAGASVREGLPGAPAGPTNPPAREGNDWILVEAGAPPMSGLCGQPERDPLLLARTASPAAGCPENQD